MISASSAWTVARDSVAQGDENLRIVQARYDNGDATTTDLLDADAALVRAKSSAASAWYDARRAEEALILAVGEDPWK